MMHGNYKILLAAQFACMRQNSKHDTLKPTARYTPSERKGDDVHNLISKNKNLFNLWIGYNFSEPTAKEALPPTSMLPVMSPVSFCHSYWTTIPFRLQSA